MQREISASEEEAAHLLINNSTLHCQRVSAHYPLNRSMPWPAMKLKEKKIFGLPYPVKIHFHF